MKQFRIAIIGCGGISAMHLAAYTAHAERAKIVATCDIIPQRAEQAKQTCGADDAFASVEETIAGADFEVAVVCTPTPVRQQIVAPLAAAGKHIFIEKPLADSIHEAQRMVALCESAGAKMAIDQTFRYYYPFEMARAQIAAGRIGKPISIIHRELAFRQDRGWRPTCARHALAVMGVHWMDGFRWMLGCEANEVRAVTHSSPAIECVGETDANVEILFDNDTAVSYVQSFSSCGRFTDTVVIGEAGALKFDHETMHLHAIGQDDGPVESWDNPFCGRGNVETTFKLLNELLVAIETDTTPPNGCVDNLKTISLLEAAWRSAEASASIFLQDRLLS